MKIWHISDTHSYHKLLEIPFGIDMVIHSGDFSNFKDVYKNEPEARDFLNWYASLDIKHKILIAGNHDALAYQWYTKFKKTCEGLGITYLENDYVTIENIKIYGSPNTPQFGDWYFMKQRHKMDKLWKSVDENVDIFVVHGPPRGILDISEKYDRSLGRCGCASLRDHIINRIKPKACLFGHIHNVRDIINAGVMKISGCETIFSNGSVVTDNKFGILTSNGNILEI